MGPKPSVGQTAYPIPSARALQITCAFYLAIRAMNLRLKSPNGVEPVLRSGKRSARATTGQRAAATEALCTAIFALVMAGLACLAAYALVESGHTDADTSLSAPGHAPLKASSSSGLPAGPSDGASLVDVPVKLLRSQATQGAAPSAQYRVADLVAQAPICGPGNSTFIAPGVRVGRPMQYVAARPSSATFRTPINSSAWSGEP